MNLIGSFGWDCAPAFVAQGIWKSVWLRVVDEAAIDYVVPVISGSVDADSPDTNNRFGISVQVHLTVTKDAEASVTVVGQWPSTSSAIEQKATATVNLDPTAGGGKTVVTLLLTADNVKLWWPNGAGMQTLHNMTVSLRTTQQKPRTRSTTSAISSPVVNGAGVRTNTDTFVTQALGFRTFDFVGSVGNNTEKYDNATLWFKVNGRPLFAKGQVPCIVFNSSKSKSTAIALGC